MVLSLKDPPPTASTNISSITARLKLPIDDKIDRIIGSIQNASKDPGRLDVTPLIITALTELKDQAANAIEAGVQFTANPITAQVVIEKEKSWVESKKFLMGIFAIFGLVTAHVLGVKDPSSLDDLTQTVKWVAGIYLGAQGAVDAVAQLKKP